MDIAAQIKSLWSDHEKLDIEKKAIHKKMVAIRTQIGKLKTISKHAEEVLNPELSELKESSVETARKIEKE